MLLGGIASWKLSHEMCLEKINQSYVGLSFLVLLVEAYEIASQ